VKICLVGSTRFIELYNKLNRELSLDGHIVYSVATTTTGNHVGLTAEEKEILDLVHLRKISESEAVVVVTDETRYVGASTSRELKWAQMNDKLVFWPDSVNLLKSFGQSSLDLLTSFGKSS
jgi:hypothetical protein